jgi:hypothetical protein
MRRSLGHERDIVIRHYGRDILAMLLLAEARLAIL